jgi:hypothetical protein
MNKTRSQLLYKFLIMYFYYFYSHLIFIRIQNRIAYPHPDSTKLVSLHTSQARPCRLPNPWGISNTVISKLRGVYHIQSCNPPRGLGITWGLKMSKLLNLIAYSLACLLTCTNWVLNCICERLAKHACQIFVTPFEMMLASLYMFFWLR